MGRHANRVPPMRPYAMSFDYVPLREGVARREGADRPRGARGGRDPDGVRLLAVSKTFPPEAIRVVHALGQREFGENYVQEAVSENGRARRSRRHRVASDRTPAEQQGRGRRTALSRGCRRSTGRRSPSGSSAARPADAPPLDVCVQVNVSGEASKSGVAPDDAVAAGEGRLPRSRACACAGSWAFRSPPTTRPAARAVPALRECLDACRAPGLPVDTLSMGMSADLEDAIAEGATLVRVGTAIFGARERRSA